MSVDSDIPKSPEDWIKVADRELKDLVVCYRGGASNGAKIDHALKAVEAMLKALFWKHERLTEWPGKNVSQYKFLYKHNLVSLQTQPGRSDGQMWFTNATENGTRSLGFMAVTGERLGQNASVSTKQSIRCRSK